MNRKKLHPLGIDEASDESRKCLPRKQNERRLLKKAYEKAILFHEKLRVGANGDPDDLLSEESSED